MNAILLYRDGDFREIPVDSAVPIGKFFGAGIGSLKYVTLASRTSVLKVSLKTLDASGANMPKIHPGMALIIGEMDDTAKARLSDWLARQSVTPVEVRDPAGTAVPPPPGPPGVLPAPQSPSPLPGKSPGTALAENSTGGGYLVWGLEGALTLGLLLVAVRLRRGDRKQQL